MKKYGVITEYDGISGNIKCVDSIDYKFLKSDLLNDISDNKHVEFEPQKIDKPDFTFYRANYVKILQKNNK